MRNAFAQELTDLAAQDERIVLLSGDIGNRLFDPFKSRYPTRFFNCGVAEANMMSVAAGLASCGLRPFVYTIVPFVTTRCLEQIRVDVCYHNMPVTIIGVGGGLSYAGLGATHHSCEDIAFLRVLPEMTVVCPGDAAEVRASVSAALQQSGPVYLRIGKKGEPVVHAETPDFEFGRAISVRDGDDVAILSTGNLLPTAMEAAEILAQQEIFTRVVSFHTVKPLDKELLNNVFSTYRLVTTLEEHSVLGGLGGAVAEWLADERPKEARLIRLGTSDQFLHIAASQDDARSHFQIDASSVARRIASKLASSPH